MRIKHSWIPFIPITLAMIAFNVLYSLNSGNAAFSLFGIGHKAFTYVNIFMCVAILILSAIICMADNLTANYYQIGKNILSGIVLILFALVLAFDGANKMLAAYANAQWSILSVVDMFITIFAAIVFIVNALSNITGTAKNVSIIYLVPGVWCCLRLFITYLESRVLSVTLIDVTYIICLALTTMFLFYQGEMITFVKSRVALRGVVAFGLSGAAISLSYAAYKIVGVLNVVMSGNVVELNVFDYLPALEVLLLGIYMIFFVAQVTANALDKTQLNVIDDSESDESDSLPNKEIDDEIIFDNEFVMDTSVDDIPNIGLENDDVYDKGEQIPTENKNSEAKKIYAENKRLGKTHRYLNKNYDENGLDEDFTATDDGIENSIDNDKTDKNINTFKTSSDFADKDTFTDNSSPDAALDDESNRKNAHPNDEKHLNDDNVYSKRLDDIDKLILELSQDDNE